MTDEVTILPCYEAMANQAFDIAFRGDTEGIDAAMASLFARHRIANSSPVTEAMRERVIAAWERMPNWDRPLLEELDLTPQGVADLADAAISAISLAQSEQLTERDAQIAAKDAEIAALREVLEKIESLGSDGEHSGDRHARCRDMARAALQVQP